MWGLPLPGRYRISRSAQALQKLMQTTLERVCTCGNAPLAHSLCEAVADAAALKVRLPQEVHVRQLQVRMHTLKV